MFDLFGSGKKKRTSIGKIEWEALKKRHGNKCIMCGQTEEKIGQLIKTHVKAHSRGGTQYIPLCPNCHNKYDKGLCNEAELKKIGLNKDNYKKVTPRKKKKADNDWLSLK